MNEDKKRETHTTSVGTIIDKLIKIYGLEKEMKILDIINGWEEMMGKAVAHRTEQLYIRNRVLHVKMNSSVLREELSHGKEIIVMRVNQFVNEDLIDAVWLE